MKKITINPHSSKLITSLTSIGYKFQTAIADLVDNSLQANASEIYIDILSRKETAKEPCVVICDNGKGMNKEELIEALRFGADRDYKDKDLGRFGLGLKTASLSQCDVLTVCSRPQKKENSKSRLNIMEWNMYNVMEDNLWRVNYLSVEELPLFKKDILERYSEILNEGGTLIIWTDMQHKFKDLYSDNDLKMEEQLSNLMQDTRQHLGMVFHKFLQKQIPAYKKIRIYIGEKEIEHFDPFCMDENTHQLDELKLPIKNSKVILSPYIIPREDQFSSIESYKKHSRFFENTHNLQGFFFYRNGRLLKHGDWDRVIKKATKLNLLRVAVSFNGTLDDEFKINISKEKASIPQELKSNIRLHLNQWIKKATTRMAGKRNEIDMEEQFNYHNYQESDHLKFELVSSDKKDVLLKLQGGDFLFQIPKNHVLATFFKKKKGKANPLNVITLGALAILEVLKRKRLKLDKIPIKKLYSILKKGDRV